MSEFFYLSFFFFLQEYKLFGFVLDFFLFYVTVTFLSHASSDSTLVAIG